MLPVHPAHCSLRGQSTLASAGLSSGLLEGFKVEKADLQEALGRKEESEKQLVLELESLGRQLEQAAQEQAALREERSVLWSQREAWAAEAEAREAGEECGFGGQSWGGELSPAPMPGSVAFLEMTWGVGALLRSPRVHLSRHWLWKGGRVAGSTHSC